LLLNLLACSKKQVVLQLSRTLFCVEALYGICWLHIIKIVK
jgi:hypothetical protein